MRFADAFEFAAGDDVEARSLLCQETENSERRVGLNGVADGVGTIREGGFEELEAVRYLVRRIDVERCVVFGCEGGEIDFVAVKRAVAIDEGAGIGLGCCDFLRQTLGALKLGGVLLARNDEPGGEVREESDAREEDKQDGNDANAAGLPSIVLRDSSAYTA